MTVSSSSLMIKLDARPNLREIERMPRGPHRKQAVWDALRTTAATSQQPFVDVAQRLVNEGALTGFETLVSPNMLIVTPAANKQGVVRRAFEVPGVKAIYGIDGAAVWPQPLADAARAARHLTPGTALFGLDVVRRGPSTPRAPGERPYGIDLVGAPDAWKQNADGRGLVFGSIDTGVDVTHEALRGRYRGAKADGTLDNDYNWMDFSPRPSADPKDYDRHGTHTVGTVVGDGVGVAPGATFIAAMGLVGKADVRLRALQWMLAPTRRDGSAADPTKAPDVVGMSWWTAASHQDLMHESIQNLNSAGIEVVKSAGNQGPHPESISSPGQFKEVNAIAAVDSSSQIADFSSRGPSPLPHPGRRPDWKPDFAAPGVDVLSSVPGDRYAKFSGTSMAQPHFSGAVLAILSRYPQLSHDQLNKVIASSAVDAGARGRDLEFGHGIVNIPAALATAAKLVAPKR